MIIKTQLLMITKTQLLMITKTQLLMITKTQLLMITKTQLLMITKTQQKRKGHLSLQREIEQQRGLVLACSTSVNTVGRRFPSTFPCRGARLRHAALPFPCLHALRSCSY